MIPACACKMAMITWMMMVAMPFSVVAQTFTRRHLIDAHIFFFDNNSHYDVLPTLSSSVSGPLRHGHRDHDTWSHLNQLDQSDDELAGRHARSLEAPPSAKCNEDSYIIDKVMANYNKNKVPGNPVNVEVEVWVQEVTTISDFTQDFQSDIYITEMWLDPGMAYSHLNPCKYNLSINSALLERMWTPNSCFVNTKEAHIHNSPFQNFFLMIYPNGTVWTNYRLKLIGERGMFMNQ